MGVKLKVAETINSAISNTYRLGAGNAANQRFDSKEEGKPVKLVGESQYDLCAVGDDIEGIVTSVEVGLVEGGYSWGGVSGDTPGIFKSVTFDGLQASPGTGVVAIGDIVVVGTPVALGTALTVPMKVCAATDATTVVHKWRVESLGSAGTGAVGTTGVVKRI